MEFSNIFLSLSNFMDIEKRLVIKKIRMKKNTKKIKNLIKIRQVFILKII